MDSKAALAAQHVMSLFRRVPRYQPMFVGLQGPQGSGKTHLAKSLAAMLSSPPNSLRLAVLSVDDLYLTHSGLMRLSEENPGNRLWKGRGLPGTHDVKLGAEMLRSLREINTAQVEEPGAANTHLILPSFDKSKFNGEGDRATTGALVSAPVDVVLLEGWCVGFYPLEQRELDEEWSRVSTKAERTPGSILHRAMQGIRKEDVQAVNEALSEYVREWYGHFEGFVQIQLPCHAPYEYIYSWRLEQEHNMKAANGGFGMTDEQVQSFVDRYIPGYEFFGKGVTLGGAAHGRPPWEGNGLCITIDQERRVIGTKNF